MLPYFTFGQKFNEKMGTALLPERDGLVEVDELYLTEITLKRQSLTELPNYYYQALPGHETAQWEVLEVVLTNLVRFMPDQFFLRKDGNHWHWHNRRLDEKTVFTTWGITLNRIQNGDKLESKHVPNELLEMISYLEPDRIKTEMFYKKAGSKYSQDQVNSAVSLLKKYSVLKGKAGEINLHRLVQNVIRLKVKNEGREADVFSMMFENLDFSLWL